MNNKVYKQHYRLTLSEAIVQYQCGLISATALLYYYLRIRFAPGWKMTLHQREISQQLGISRDQFYRGIQRLKDKGLIDWEAPNGLVVELVSSTNVLDKTATSEQNCDSVDKTATAVDKTATAVDKTATATRSKTASSKVSSPSSDSYQIFIKSLSDSEGENFLNFVREQVKNLPQPINDVEAWLANENKAGQNRWEIYYQNFLAKQSTKKEATRRYPSLQEEIEERIREIDRLKSQERKG